MATLTTALQIAVMLETARKRHDAFTREFKDSYFPNILDMLVARMFLRRPHTDDMMQMCADLGVDVPERNLTSPDGRTFYWSIQMPQHRGANYGQHRRTRATVDSNPTDRTDHGSRRASALRTVTVRTVLPEPIPEPAIPSAGIRAGEIIGHRLWWSLPRDDDGPLLCSLTHDRFWMPGEVVSGNTHLPVSTGRRGVIWGGVYSYSTSGPLHREILYWTKLLGTAHTTRSLISGRIKMWGDVVEHREGYRAEYAKIIALDAVVWGGADLEALRRFYFPPVED